HHRRDRSNDNIQETDPKRPYLELKMRVADRIGTAELHMGDYHACERSDAGKEAAQIQSVDHHHQLIVGDKRWGRRRRTFDIIAGFTDHRWIPIANVPPLSTRRSERIPQLAGSRPTAPSRSAPQLAGARRRRYRQGRQRIWSEPVRSVGALG